MPVPSWAQEGPLLIGFLFCVVFFRAQGTYWLGRLIPAGLVRTSKTSGPIYKVAEWFRGPTPRRGAALLEHWGIIIIPLCFLTVGLQTTILAGSGLVRMKWQKFTLAMLPGCVAWAFLYGLGMLAVWTAAVKAIAGNPWSWLAVAAVVGAFFLFGRWKKHQTGRILTGGKTASVPALATVRTDDHE